MNSSASNINITVDDWSPLLRYEPYSEWQTPDPSSPTFNASATPWLDGTYHLTNVVNASVTLNFTGPAIYIYGASGPSYGSYSVLLSDGSGSPYTTQRSAHSATNGSNPHLLFGASNLTYAKHTLVLTNLGAENGDEGAGDFLLDFILETVQLGPAGATLTNTTVENSSSLLNYTGTWSTNTSPYFSGGTSSFTSSDGSSVSLSFQGSALYIFGDTVNDHGLFTVTLDTNPPETYDGVSGCGGTFGKLCEKTMPSLIYFASNLGNETHTVTIQNLAGVNHSFFDLDRFVYTTPSSYAPVQLSNTSTPFSSSTSISPTATAKSSADMIYSANPLLLLLWGLLWCLHQSRH